MPSSGAGWSANSIDQAAKFHLATAPENGPGSFVAY